ncbi:hypothetical protein BO70DRAFT_7789 [Aspergillus heteromorphus CBS 117.55]|uniref:Uncharacterized protein n=1 Tax=Aspergillus heteromorphus CBS 117.55 TaxID=1448321 RepID=A0A317X418_9EURO|nr:uncharacterized protein BO70DRAFT_7789 [Aspergillus heteromorphus CBS 117.55]PWY92352.1 hypothetical protein BO70DRAFT_7789 [Aspergillus heteromorphus CBS 117.55]
MVIASLVWSVACAEPPTHPNPRPTPSDRLHPAHPPPSRPRGVTQSILNPLLGSWPTRPVGLAWPGLPCPMPSIIQYPISNPQSPISIWTALLNKRLISDLLIDLTIYLSV